MKTLLIGLESGDQDALDSMNKRTSTAANRKAIEICRANDVEIVAYLIVDPSFDRDDFRRLSDYVAENKLTHPIFTILSPFPGTNLYEEVKHNLTTDGFELIDFYHTVLPTKLPLEDFYAEFLNLYKRAYPLKGFFASAIKNRATLTPRNIVMSLQFKRKMSKLASHHDLVSSRSPAGSPPCGVAVPLEVPTVVQPAGK
jgi:radical SAM superfamily enzyme YgiQ (UPF0313 family)